MTIPPKKRSSQPGTLFLTYLCPSLAGSGPQIRSAALLRMLAARGDVHILVVNRHWQMPGPCDPCSEGCAAAMTYLRILPDTGTAGRWIRVVNEVPYPALPTVDCPLTGVADFISDYVRKHRLEQLFVFRMETLFFVQGCLDFFPLRLLDLDELPSRRDRLITVLRGTPFSPEEKRAHLTSQVLEKKLIPRFNHVFVASDTEADEVRRHTAFQHPFVLPNIRPQESMLAPSPRTGPHEILFVGVLSYLPNRDGVLWFCREILPLLRQKRGDSILFRIIGFGDSPALDPIRNLPGVCLSGYQANLAPFYAGASMAVIPLRGGTGTRLKILEAFAYARPVVSTTVGAEGLAVTHDKNILLADTAETFSEACLSLIDRPERVRPITESAGRLCRELYSEEALLRRYDEIMAP